LTKKELQEWKEFEASLGKGNYNSLNMVKLQNFKKRVFVIGVYDDPLEAMIELPLLEELQQDGSLLNLFQKVHGDGTP